MVIYYKLFSIENPSWHCRIANVARLTIDSSAHFSIDNYHLIATTFERHYYNSTQPYKILTIPEEKP